MEGRRSRSKPLTSKHCMACFSDKMLTFLLNDHSFLNHHWSHTEYHIASSSLLHYWCKTSAIKYTHWFIMSSTACWIHPHFSSLTVPLPCSECISCINNTTYLTIKIVSHNRLSNILSLFYLNTIPKPVPLSSTIVVEI